MSIDVQKIIDEAQSEIVDVKVEKVKKLLKEKLKELDAAKDVVANLEREYAEQVELIRNGVY